MRSIIITSLMLVIVSCSQKETRDLDNNSNDNEIEIIRNTISSNIGWFKNKDFDLLNSIVAHDSNFICVHPTDKVIKGYDQFLSNSEVFKNPDFIYVRHELKDLKITLSKTGDVAWYYCILNDINSYKGQPANWENVRWTGVLEKRNDKWVIVQHHFSFTAE
jgi:ketosteroid isomerase-like protein